MKKNKRYIAWGLTAFLVILGGLISYYIIFHLDNFKAGIKQVLVILMPVIDGIILAYLMTPLVNLIERKVVSPFFILIHCKKKSSKRAVSVLLTLAVVIMIVYGFFALIIPQILTSIETIIMQFPTYIENVETLILQLFKDNPDLENIANNLFVQYSGYLENFVNQTLLPQLNSLIMTISKSVVSILKDLWNLIIGLIISIYLIGSKERFAAQAKKIAYAFFPVETANRFVSNVRFSSKTFSGFFIGKIVDSIIIGILCFVVISIIGTPFPVLISVIVGVTNVIPFFGPFLGAIPSLVLIVLVDPVQALYFLIFVIILQQLDGNVIGPKILGNSTGLPGFWVIFSITLFGGLFGVLGMILGVPVFAVIFAFIKSIVETRLENKELPKETGKYLKLLYIDTEEDGTFVEMDEFAPKPFEGITQILVRSQKRIKQIEQLKKQTSGKTTNSKNSKTDDESE